MGEVIKLKHAVRKSRLKREERIEDSGDIYVLFALAGENYALGIEYAREILKPKDITEIPFTPTYVKGVINLRGKIVPVIDLRLRFDLAEKELAKETRIIIGRRDEQDIGMLVDRVIAVQTIPDSTIEPTPEMISRAVNADFFAGVANIEETVFAILDIEKTLRKPVAEAGL